MTKSRIYKIYFFVSSLKRREFTILQNIFYKELHTNVLRGIKAIIKVYHFIYCVNFFTVIRGKVRKVVNSGDNSLLYLKKSKKVYKRDVLSKKEKKNLKPYIQGGLHCDCDRINSTSNDKYLIMGNKTGSGQFTVSFVSKWNKRDRNFKRAIKAMRRGIDCDNIIGEATRGGVGRGTTNRVRGGNKKGGKNRRKCGKKGCKGKKKNRKNKKNRRKNKNRKGRKGKRKGKGRKGKGRGRNRNRNTNTTVSVIPNRP